MMHAPLRPNPWLIWTICAVLLTGACEEETTKNQVKSVTDVGMDLQQVDPIDARDATVPDIIAAPDLGRDALAKDADIPDAAHRDSSPPVDMGPDIAIFQPSEPLRILFIGNSFTLGGPVPVIVEELAIDAGWPAPEIVYRAYGGESLQGHRGRSTTVASVDQGDWDAVVLQEYSTKPTDNIGDPLEFKEDATWFHDRIKTSSPEARIVLYETWARHEDHSFYPNRFVDPAEMQSQLRFHYNDAATSYVPSNASQTVNPAIEVAPVGDAWEHHLGQPDPVRLHASDDYHAGSRGQYLNALVIYSTLYRRSALDLTSRALAGEDALRLQLAADAVTGQTVPGGPTGMPKPVGLTRGETVRIDFGDRITSEIGWNNLDDATSGALGNLVTTEGESSTVDIAVTDNFGGVNNAGIGANGLGYPATASEDSLFAGSFDDHADGLLHPGEVTISGLDPQARYRAEIFASRSGSDNGRGRLTRFVVGGTFQDLEVSDNTDVYVTYLDLIPSSQGEIAIEVAVSPDGTSRFAYIGVLHLTRQ